MIPYNEIKEKKIIVFNNEPHLVLSSHVFRKQQRKAVNQTTLRNLTSGSVVEHTFAQSDSVEEAFLESKELDYIFSKRGEHWFHEHGNPKKRFPLEEKVLGDSRKMIKQGSTITAHIFNPDENENWFEHIVGIELPIKVDLEVVEAPPNVKGNTADGGTKRVTLETGLEINTPLFIETGDVVRVNTQTKEYVERAK